MSYWFSSYSFEFGQGVSTAGSAVRRASEASEKIDYTFDDRSISAATGSRIDPIASDLIDVFAMVHIADRYAVRSVSGNGNRIHAGWQRRLELSLPMRNPNIWRIDAVATSLRDLLRFATDDDWQLNFAQRAILPRPAESQRLLLPSELKEPKVILNSGGLDSLAGISKLLSLNSGVVIPVTLKTNPRRRTRADIVVEAMRGTMKHSERSPQLLPTEISVSFPGASHRRNERESSQRARSLLCLAIGTAAALSAGQRKLYVCENGLGALSLPMNADHWGARATRAMNPQTLAMFADLVSQTIGDRFEIVNVGLSYTKGELIGELINSGFREVISSTATCDSASYLEDGVSCGKCSSCLLRRCGLIQCHEGVLLDRKAVYKVDLSDFRQVRTRSNTLHFSAMEYQVEIFRNALMSKQAFSALAQLFPSLASWPDSIGVPRPDLETSVVELIRRHVKEFERFAAFLLESATSEHTLIHDSAVAEFEKIAG